MNKEVRVRFAPSPTGALHIGGVRTALYNYLFAKKHNGKFILRIEDTDQSRYVAGAEDYITESLNWVGIIPDESPRNGGEYGPYRQSERKNIYQQYAQKLIDDGNAYYAFDTADELEAMRERLKEAKVANQQYNAITRMQMINSLTLSEEECKSRLASGEPYVIRLKVPRKEEIRLNDLVRGWVMVHSTSMDDKVLMKSDGMPTYHLANVVDDYLMKITHVIRGEEWLPSAPLHVLLYQFLGWADVMPKFAHLPLLLKPDGNGKLSKRDGDKLGFPVFPISGVFPGKDGNPENYTGFRESGYLPDAFLNFLALLGWNPGTEEEIFDKLTLIEKFSIERIGKAGTKFDIDKAKWFNEQYIKNRSDEDLVNMLQSQLSDKNITISDKRALKICQALRERLVFPQDLWNIGKVYFIKPEHFDEKVITKKWNILVVKVLEDYGRILKDKKEINADEAKRIFVECIDKHDTKMGAVMQSLRLALTGEGSGPDLMEIIEIIGPAESAERIFIAIDSIKIPIS